MGASTDEPRVGLIARVRPGRDHPGPRSTPVRPARRVRWTSVGVRRWCDGLPVLDVRRPPRRTRSRRRAGPVRGAFHAAAWASAAVRVEGW